MSDDVTVVMWGEFGRTPVINKRVGRDHWPNVGSLAIIGGGYLLKSGLEKRNEAQIHVQAMEELGMSLEAEITPQVIELEEMWRAGGEDDGIGVRDCLGDVVLRLQVAEHRFGSGLSHLVCMIRVADEPPHLMPTGL